MKKLFVLLMMSILGFLCYYYRHLFINRLLMNETRRRILIKVMMEVPPLRRYILRKYSPFELL